MGLPAWNIPTTPLGFSACPSQVVRIEHVADVAMAGGIAVESSDLRHLKDNKLAYATHVEMRSIEQRQDDADGLRDPDLPGEFGGSPEDEVEPWH